MQALRDYLNNTKQCESILDPNQDQVMDKMTGEMIRRRIKEYCDNTSSNCWPTAWQNIKPTKIDRDNKGWYIDTESPRIADLMVRAREKSYYDYCESVKQKTDKQRGFLIKDTDIYFRWRKHKGGLWIEDSPNFESTDGLPEELDALYIVGACLNSKGFDVRNKINLIQISDIDYDIKISGKGCKHIMISPDGIKGNVIVPAGVSIHHPEDWTECDDLTVKLAGSYLR